ncbi:epimerase [Nonomuraea typhae]|uniref:epimerase n=1 Tax=Nonomuraea typhae TaxID=2603600 RepID=UPI0012F8605B|nr:epimerase [Nonomuraea typhae]
MRVILFGATGMVGRGALRECLLDAEVTRVLAVGRASCGVRHEKLDELIVPDLFALEPIDGYDACLFCLGVSSVGMSEAAYRRVTYDLTLSVAEKLSVRRFCYVSGAGADGRAMWARVKSATEQALIAMEFDAYSFRPGYIQPMHGIRSRTAWYRLAYVAAAPVYPIVRRLIPNRATSTETLGRAMLRVAKDGYRRPILETGDINLAGDRTSF